MKKLLVIEDNLEIRDNTAEILELANYEVLTAEDGIKGAGMALICHPDLIICDILMPGMDGYEILNLLHSKEELRHIPFIFLTALAEPSDMIKGMELGADDYIIKPFTADELLEAVARRLTKGSTNQVTQDR